jgi:class 3 adenylate cyclase/tetratricopeptide (TPR) repeat protein
MSDPLVERILAELAAPGARVVPLLQAYRLEEHEPCWRADPHLYRAFGKGLISAGQPTLAFELVREGLHYHHGDHLLLFLRALALARGRNYPKAEEYVHELLQASDLALDLRVEALGLAGRLKKDRYQAAGRAGGTALAQESAELYAAAAGLAENGDAPRGWLSANAATMSLLAGQPEEKVHAQARDALRQALLEQQQPGMGDDYWLLATLGEARLLLGNDDEAVRHYSLAIARAGSRIGDLAAMRRQVRLLRDRLPTAQRVLDLFQVGSVVVLVGHMLDRPGAPTRFPPDPRLEQRVRQAIAEELDRLQPAVGYCSGACGSDLLFAELMLERDRELHLVVPFARTDFYQTSVDFGLEQMGEYRRRFDAVAQRAQVHYGTEEGYLHDHALLEYVSSYCHGLAVVRADELDAEAWALAVVDPGSPVRPGGTRYFLNGWEGHGRKSRTIDLARLRDEVRPQPPDWWPAARPTPLSVAAPAHRELKVMLFADVKNYSRLTDRDAPAFFVQFLGEVGRVIQAGHRYPAMCNTWGDGLFLVFNHVLDGADFALRLLDCIGEMDFARIGLPPDTTVRVGLHAGPVFPHWDQLIGRLNFFGTHVNRAARIEPKTPPGCVYASEQFAALLAVEPNHDFACEYVGVYQLGKEHDRFACPLYRLARKGK